MAELLLEHAGNGAADCDAASLLLSPAAEHTPLMQAVRHGADAATVKMLTAKTARMAAAALASRDGTLNTVLHLAGWRRR